MLGLEIVASPDAAQVARFVTLTATRCAFGRDPPGGGVRVQDPKMSREHFAVAQEGHVHAVQDLGSRNGLLVDRRYASRAWLEDGLLLRAGRTVLLCRTAECPASHAAEVWEVTGGSASVVAVRDTIARVAPTSLTVLVLGDTGTGKERVAQAIHRLSGRPGPLVTVNCGAIPAPLVERELFGHKRGAFTDAVSDSQGLLQSADGGTLFLDEIGEMPLEMQPALLRVLETGRVRRVGDTAERPVDVRFVAATNRDLRAAADARLFRPDLLARLSDWAIELLPLSERRGDILPLITAFRSEQGLPPAPPWDADTAEALLSWAWPANSRELRQAVRRLAVYESECGAWRLDHLPIEMTETIRLRANTPSTADGVIAAPTRSELEVVVARSHGQVAAVARHFGRDRKQVYRWLERHGLRPEDYRQWGA